ncbi:hypothetical protein VPH35_022836 [Triticum aestivum]
MSRPRSRTRRAFPRTSSALSLLASSWRMAVPLLTTTSRRSPPFTLSSAFGEACRSSSRPSPARPSRLRWSLLTPSTTSRPRSRTRRAFPRTSSALSSQASSWRMAAPSRTTTSRRSPPSTLSCVCVVACRSS